MGRENSHVAEADEIRTHSSHFAICQPLWLNLISIPKQHFFDKFGLEVGLEKNHDWRYI